MLEVADFAGPALQHAWTGQAASCVCGVTLVVAVHTEPHKGSLSCHPFCVRSHGEALNSDTITVLQELRGADDHTIINQYFDAIDALVALVMEGHGAQAKDEGLCETVLHLQEVGTQRTSRASCRQFVVADSHGRCTAEVFQDKLLACRMHCIHGD